MGLSKMRSAALALGLSACGPAGFYNTEDNHAKALAQLKATHEGKQPDNSEVHCGVETLEKYGEGREAAYIKALELLASRVRQICQVKVSEKDGKITQSVETDYYTSQKFSAEGNASCVKVSVAYPQLNPCK